MTFRRHGRSYHLLIDSSEGLRQAIDLDESLWVATNAPVSMISGDSVLCHLLDSDSSGRITCLEIKRAICWVLDVLASHDGIDAGSDTLLLDAINTESAQGRAARAAAEKILAKADSPNADRLTLAETRLVKAAVAAMPVSEAGVVLPSAADSEEVRQFIVDAIAVTGGAEHPSGDRGLDAERLDKFVQGVRGVLEWQKTLDIPPGSDKSEVMPLGKATVEAFAAMQAVLPKVDLYFAQCQAASLDERLAQRINSGQSDLANLDTSDLAAIKQTLASAPLAKLSSAEQLNLEGEVNPHYSGKLAEFRRKVVGLVLGEDVSTLKPAQWDRIKSFFAAHQAYLQAKPSSSADSLGRDKLVRYLDESLAESVNKLIGESAAAAVALDNVRMVEKLILCQKWLIDLANNFVSFPHLYDPRRRAMFEAGSLVMDGRRFNLAVWVEDRGKHIKLAEKSSLYVMYLEVTSGGSAEPYELAVPVTAGGRGNLCVGKRGVFYDLAGNECDATIVHIIENPISISEALASPFVRLGRLLTGKIESFTSQAEKKLDAVAAEPLSTKVSQVSSQSGKSSGGLAAGGMVMGAGVAVAALGSAVAYIAKTVAGHWESILVVVFAAIGLVAILTSIVAFMKLRKRDLSAILEASGWGINARMRLTRRQRNYFTQRLAYPSGSKGVHRGRRLWLACIVLIVLLLTAASVIAVHRGSSSPTAATQASGR